jgi:integrase
MAIYKLSSAKIAAAIRAARTHPHGRIQRGDGGGLWLIVSDHGENQSWVFRYTHPITRKECRMGLGALHTIDLDRARELAKANRILLGDGRDPKEERKQRLLDQQIAEGRAKTVSQVADAYFRELIAPMRTSYVENSKRILRDFVHTKIGHLPIEKVDRHVIQEMTGLPEAWRTQYPTARKAYFHILRLFGYAEAKGLYHGESPQVWKTHLKRILPSSKRVHRKKSLNWMPREKVGAFLEKYRARRSLTRESRGKRSTIDLCTEFIILSGARPGEVTKATWDEIKGTIWLVPSDHLKTGGLHGNALERPLTKPMLSILEEMQTRRTDQSPGALIFPSLRGRPLPPKMPSFELRRYLRSIGESDKVTVHGFRSTLRDWCRANKFPESLWNFQVDHAQGDQSSQSYGHDTLLDDRRDMMEKWGEYCSRPAPDPQSYSNVTHIADRRA